MGDGREHRWHIFVQRQPEQKPGARLPVWRYERHVCVRCVGKFAQNWQNDRKWWVCAEVGESRPLVMILERADHCARRVRKAAGVHRRLSVLIRRKEIYLVRVHFRSIISKTNRPASSPSYRAVDRRDCPLRCSHSSTTTPPSPWRITGRT